jgi:hypothetical protein
MSAPALTWLVAEDNFVRARVATDPRHWSGDFGPELRSDVDFLNYASVQREKFGFVFVADLQVCNFAHVSSCLPLYSELLGVCDGSGRATWRDSRKRTGTMARPAMPSICEGRIRSRGKGAKSESWLPAAEVCNH